MSGWDNGGWGRNSPSEPKKDLCIDHSLPRSGEIVDVGPAAAVPERRARMTMEVIWKIKEI